MQCWYCLKETRMALVGENAVCYICIGNEIENPAKTNFRGDCVCCGKEIGKRKGLFGLKTLSPTLVKGNEALCSECFTIAKESRQKALLERGHIPENTKFISKQSFQGPTPFNVSISKVSKSSKT